MKGNSASRAIKRGVAGSGGAGAGGSDRPARHLEEGITLQGDADIH
jgi:hypothetical protein